MDKLLADGKTVQLQMYHEGPFEEEANRRFPELKDDLQFYTGMVYSIVDVFADTVQEAIETGDVDLIKKVFAFLGYAISQPRSGEVANAIQISSFDLDALEKLPSSVTIEELIPEGVKELIVHGQP